MQEAQVSSRSNLLKENFKSKEHDNKTAEQQIFELDKRFHCKK